MSAQSEEAMRLLREMHTMLSGLTKTPMTVYGVGTPTAVATDADLDGPHGNPVIKAKSPRDWTGDPMTGKTFSECPPADLEMLADRFDYFNTRETDDKKRGYNARDAARARGWAARLRSGWTPAPSAGDWTPEELPKW